MSVDSGMHIRVRVRDLVHPLKKKIQVADTNVDVHLKFLPVICICAYDTVILTQRHKLSPRYYLALDPADLSEGSTVLHRHKHRHFNLGT